MTDMNQSFIRAFAKKDAAVNSQRSKSAPVADTKPMRRASVLTQNPQAPVENSAPSTKVASSQRTAVERTTAEPLNSLASLYNSESVMVFSTFDDASNLDGSAMEPQKQAPWTPAAAEAAQAATAQVPRGIAAKSTIPAPPAPSAQLHAGPKKAVQRVDVAHKSAPVLPKIAPAWEIDKLLWPRTCDQLLAAEKSYFEEAAGRLLEASRQGMRTLAVCGSRRGEGCSTVALCIAKSAAAAGLRIGILDADLLSDGLAEMLGLEVDCNWTQAAVDAAAIHEQAVQVLDQAITLFPMSRNQRQSTAKLTTAQLSLIPQIAEQFDLLIVDCGVFNEGALAQTLAAKVNIDAALVVRDLRHTSSRSVHATVSQIRDSGIEAVGIAENFGAR